MYKSRRRGSFEALLRRYSSLHFFKDVAAVNHQLFMYRLWVLDCSGIDGQAKLSLYLGNIVGDQQVLRRLEGHSQRVNAVCFGGDDAVMASASYDQTVRD
jgi:WD40 repeat protein